LAQFLHFSISPAGTNTPPHEQNSIFM